MMKKFSASLDNLRSMIEFVHEQANLAGINTAKIAKIELATEEAIVNVINYAYPENHCFTVKEPSDTYIATEITNKTIEIMCTPIDGGGIKIDIKDYGIPYNPLHKPKPPDISSPLEARLAGGLGIYFFTKIMDEVTYNRDIYTNILTFVKY